MRRQSGGYDYRSRRDYPEYDVRSESSRDQGGSSRTRDEAPRRRNPSSEDARTTSPIRGYNHPRPDPRQRQQSLSPPRGPRSQSRFSTREHDSCPLLRPQDSDMEVTVCPAQNSPTRDEPRMGMINDALMGFASVVSDLSVLKYQQSLAKASRNKWIEEDENIKGIPQHCISIQAHIVAQRQAAEKELELIDKKLETLQKKEASTALRVAELISTNEPNEQVHKCFDELGDHLRLVQEKVDLLNRATDPVAQTIRTQTNHESRLVSIQKSVEQIRNDVHTLEQQQSKQDPDLKAEIDDIQRTIISLESRPYKVKEPNVPSHDFERLKTKIENLDTELQKQGSMHFSLQEAHSKASLEMSSQIQESRADFQKQIEKVTALEAEVEALHIAQEPTFHAILTDINHILSRLKECDTQIAQQANEINELATARALLLTRCDKMAREIRLLGKRPVVTVPTSAADTVDNDGTNGTKQESSIETAIQNLRTGLENTQNDTKGLQEAVRRLDGQYTNLTTEPVVRAMLQVMSTMYPSPKETQSEISTLKKELAASHLSNRTIHTKLFEQAEATEGFAKGQITKVSAELNECQNRLRDLEDVQNRNAEKDERNVQAMMKARNEFQDQLTTLGQRIDDTLARLDTVSGDTVRMQALLEKQMETIKNPPTSTKRSISLHTTEAVNTAGLRQEHVQSPASENSDILNVANGPLRKSLLKSKKRRVSERSSESDDVPLMLIRR